MRKTPYSLCESCRWVRDLQLSYSTFGALLYKILEFFNFEQRASNTLRLRRRRARVPAGLGVRAVRCPRPPTGRGSLFPMRRAPRPLESSWPRARHGPRCTGSVRAVDRQSDGGAPPYARRSRPGTTTASPRSRCRHPGRAAPINVTSSPLLTPALLLHRAIRAAAVELRPSCFSRPSNRPCPFPRPYRTLT
jgi:hypothetical protein